MNYQLPDGRVVNISLEAYLELDDDQFFIQYQELMANPAYGKQTDNPYEGMDKIDTSGPDPEESDDEHEPELDELNPIEKLKDLDLELPED